MSVPLHTQDVRGCPCVYVCVRQYTQDVRGCPAVHISALHTGRPWVSASTHRTSVAVRQYTEDVRGCLCVSVSTHRTSMGVCQHAQDVRVCPPAHTARPWLSISTHKTSVAVCGCPCVSVGVRQHTQDIWAVPGCSSAHTGRPCVSVSTHRTSVCVRVCPSAHTGRLWLSVCVRVCPSAHTGHLWLSISTHISTLVLGLSTLALLVECLDDFGPRRLFVQYTQDVRGCLPAHTGRPWLSGAVRQHTQDVRGRPCVSVCVCWCPPAHTGRLWLSMAVHQHTQDVRRCPSAHTGRPCVYVCVRQHTQDVRGCPSEHISARWSLDSACWPFSWTFWVILAHVGCLFSTHNTSVGVQQHTQDVRGCLSAHSGRPWLSVCVRQHTQDVRGCLSAHTGRPCVSASTHSISVAVRQHTQDVRGCPCVSVCVCGCPPAHTGRLWLSLAVRQHTQDVRVCPSAHTRHPCVCPCVSISTHSTSVAVQQYTYQHAGPWTQHAGPSLDCLGDFGPRGMSVQYTQDVRGCPSAHTGHLWLSVCVRQHTHDVRGCPAVHISARWSLDSAR
ncbi:hypothetical protein YC2023_066101 [Brassica napus]